MLDTGIVGSHVCFMFTAQVQTELQEVTKQRDNSVVALNEQMELVKSLKGVF